LPQQQHKRGPGIVRAQLGVGLASHRVCAVRRPCAALRRGVEACGPSRHELRCVRSACAGI
jgi:hypothetical protein